MQSEGTIFASLVYVVVNVRRFIGEVDRVRSWFVFAKGRLQT